MPPLSNAWPSRQSNSALEGLRHKLVLLERPTGLASDQESLTVGLAAVDAALAGGLARAAVHEISALCEVHSAAASRFAWALAGILLGQSRDKAAIWIAQDLWLFENGDLYGPGLVDAGIAPERLITVAAPRRREVLWAMEEALRCRAAGVVIGELGMQSLDQAATRRLSLAAAAGNTLGLILRAAPDEAPCACATRWIIGAAPSATFPGNQEKFRGIGPPRLCVHLVRNRRGHPGAWLVEWNSVEQRFELATDPLSVAQSAIDRQAHAVVA